MMTTEGTTFTGSTGTATMGAHPDIVELRDRLDRVAETPQARAVEGLAVMGGLYAAISPWIIGFTTGNPGLTISNLVVGLTVALLALDLGSAYSRAHGLSWVMPLLGAWILISQWVMTDVADTTGIMVSNVIAGAVIIVLGAIAMAMPRMTASRHG